MRMTLRQEILSDKLHSDLSIYEAKYKSETSKFTYDARDTLAIIENIKEQIEELTSEIKKQNM